MAAGDSAVKICNLALSALGQDPISSLDDRRKAAIHCKLWYDQARREILRAGVWDFATAREECAASSVQPPFGRFAAFQLPNDFIRVVALEGLARDTKYTIEGNAILVEGADASGALNLIYIFDCTDPTKFDPLFVAALARAVATEVAKPITGSTQEAAAQGQMTEGKLATARLVNSQDTSGQEFDMDVLLGSRN